MPPRRPPRPLPPTRSTRERLQPWVTPATVVAVGLVLFTVTCNRIETQYDRLDRQIAGAENRIKDTVKALDTRVGDLDGRLRQVERDTWEIRGRVKAAALGMDQSEIRKVSLEPSRSFEASGGVAPVGYDLTFQIVSLVGNMIEMEVNGRIGGLRISRLRLTFPLQPGALTRIPIPFGVDKQKPEIYIALLERLSPQEAVIAVGPKIAERQS